MKPRVLLPSTLALLLAFAGAPSWAATKPKPQPVPPYCNLIVSAKGDTPSVLARDGNGTLRFVLDTTHQPTPYATPPGYDPALDLLSADIASTSSTISVVFRVASLSGAAPAGGLGRHYNFAWSWKSSGVGSNLYADITAQGATSGPSSGGTVIVDVAHNEIRVNQPIDRMNGHPLLPPGERMANLTVTTDLSVNAMALSGSSGLAGELVRGTKDYPHMAPSCVRFGR